MAQNPPCEANRSSASDGTWRFFTALTSARHLSLSWENFIRVGRKMYQTPSGTSYKLLGTRKLTFSFSSKCEEELLVSQEGLAQRNCAENLLYRILPKLANNYVKCGYKLLYTLKHSDRCTFFTKISLLDNFFPKKILHQIPWKSWSLSHTHAHAHTHVETAVVSTLGFLYLLLKNA
jgi:hypothetical protein